MLKLTLDAILGVTVLLSLTVFQQTVSESMPITSLQIPLLGKLVTSKDRLQTICSRIFFERKDIATFI